MEAEESKKINVVPSEAVVTVGEMTLTLNEIIVPAPQPIEEMLGSVTTYNNIDGSDALGSSRNCQQLRTSARVFKKMKLDSTLALVTAPTLEKEKKDVVKDEVKTEVKKPLRPTWSVEEKDLFFEGLYEYGKDFDAIQQYIITKCKKKGLPESVIKTKDQVRHFYYRTWHKVSKHLKFSEDIKKIAQELYALINYGEIRKKVGPVTEKTLMKLNELIYRGAVQIRSKGKTIRIKTPMCNALRRLNQLDEKHEDLKLPTRVLVELRPKNMETWIKVQFMAQNPRIRLSLPLQRRLSVVMSCINERWRTQIARTHEKILNSVKKLLDESTPDTNISEEGKEILNPRLRFTPKVNASIQVPTINLSEYVTSHRICLNAYEERIGVKIPGELMWQNMCASFKGGGRGNTRRERLRRMRIDLLNDKNNVKLKENCDENECDNGPTVTDVDTMANTGLTVLKTETVSENGCFKEDNKNDVSEVDKMEKVNDENKTKEINRIQNGWILEECGTLTIGELYLMFGHDSKIELEYSWDVSPNLIKTELEEKVVATTSTNETEKEGSADDKPPNNLSVTLKKLLSVAKLHYRKERINCPCGHICGKTKCNSMRAKNNLRVLTDQGDNGIVKYTNNNDAKSTTTYISPQNCMRNVTVGQDGIFRRPTMFMDSNVADNFKAQLDSLQKMPRYCNRRGRPVRSKQVVVERMLPLLPKPSINGHSMVTMKVVSQSMGEMKSTPNPRPIAPKGEECPEKECNIKEEQLFFNAVQTKDTPLEILNDCPLVGGSPAELEIPDGEVSSSTTITNFLNLDIPSTDTNDLILSNTANCDKDITSFAGLLSDDHPSETTPLSSPSRILKETDIQWLNSVHDFSFTSLLGHLDSPLKTSQTTIIPEDAISQDIDAQFPSFMGENGVDFVEQFVDMAAQVNCENNSEQISNT